MISKEKVEEIKSQLFDLNGYCLTKLGVGLVDIILDNNKYELEVRENEYDISTYPKKSEEDYDLSQYFGNLDLYTCYKLYLDKALDLKNSISLTT